MNAFTPRNVAPLDKWKVVLQACGVTVEELTVAGATGRLTVAELDSFFVDEPQVAHITLLLGLRPDAAAIAETIGQLARRTTLPLSE